MTIRTATRTLRADGAAIAAAAAVIRAGGLAAFPTETVYGLGGDARDDRAVAAIYAAKARPRFNPLIAHVAGHEDASQYVEFSPLARKLADAFWPGALTLVLPRKPSGTISLLACAGLDTVAVRAPAHPVAQALIRAAGAPIAAPSANRAGAVSPTIAAHVAAELDGRVEIILDGGPTPLGIESTVVGFEEGRAVLLRPGALARARIAAVAGSLTDPNDPTLRAPGGLRSHYAPQTRLRLDAAEPLDGEALLAFGPRVPQGAVAVRNLSVAGDLAEAAANFFAMLRELDALRPRAIAVMPIPDEGLGEAINDRLRRAAAPREDATP